MRTSVTYVPRVVDGSPSELALEARRLQVWCFARDACNAGGTWPWPGLSLVDVRSGALTKMSMPLAMLSIAALGRLCGSDSNVRHMSQKPCLCGREPHDGDGLGILRSFHRLYEMFAYGPTGQGSRLSGCLGLFGRMQNLLCRSWNSLRWVHLSFSLMLITFCGRTFTA